MTWNAQAEAICVIVTTLAALWGAVRSFQRSQREQAKQIADDKQATYNRGVIDGQHGRDDEVRQLKFERDDAHADRDRVQLESDDWKRRYLDLQERRGS